MQLTHVAPEEILRRVEAIRSVRSVVDPYPISKLEEIRADNNGYIRSVKDEIRRAKEKYLEPFTALEKEALSALEPLEEENSAFQKEILERKKEAFKGKVREAWEFLSSLDPDGNIAPFPEIYDPSWYGLPEKEWKPRLLSSIRAYIEKGNVTTAYFVLENCTVAQMRSVEEFLIAQRISYRKENV